MTDEKRIQQMIAQGESTTLEFKSTIRYNLKEKKNKDEAVEHQIIKSVCAFLNSRFGGHLLIGVDDRAQPTVLKSMASATRTKLCSTLATSSAGTSAGSLSPSVDLRVVMVEGKPIVWIHVKPSLFGPAWYGSGEDRAFYVREGEFSKIQP